MTNTADATEGASARRSVKILFGAILVLLAVESAWVLYKGSDEPWLRRYNGIAMSLALAANVGAMLVPDRALVQRVARIATWVFLAFGAAGLIANIRAGF